MHIPVMKKEVLEYLDPKPSQHFIDCTIGLSGHANAILEKTAPEGKLLGIEWDREVFEKIRPSERMILENDSYANLKKIVEKHNFKNVSGILFDLGISSWDLEGSGRGFSFLRKEPLDMRFSQNSELTAHEIVNYWNEKEIAEILKEYGEERFSGRIARKIVESRPIRDTLELAETVKRSFPKSYKFREQHVAKRTFQSLRIAVNDELNNLKKGLEQAGEILDKNGRLVVISFHSLEDRIVKNFFKNNFRVLTKKPVTSSEEELKENRRAKSAKLRVGIKL